MRRHLKKHAGPLLAGVAVVALALLLWRTHRAANPRPRPLGDGELGLLVIENVPAPEGVREQRLVRYPVKGGEVGAGEVIWTGDVGFFRHWGQNQTLLVENRYLVTRYGGVLDLHRGKVIHGHDGRDGVPCAIERGRVIFEAGHRPACSYFAFDLERARLRPVDGAANWSMPGLRSPGGTKSAVEDRGSGIVLHRAGREPRSLGDDFFVRYSVNSSTHGLPPMVWLDDDRLLTQTGNGKLVVVRVEDGSRSPPLDVPATDEVVGPPCLWRDAEGGVIYECGCDPVLVDADARRWSRYVWHRLGHGFEASLEAAADERTIRHDGRTIGRFIIPHGVEAVTRGHVAVVTGEDRVAVPWGRRVRVWSAASEKWTVLDAPCDRIIGWVK